MRALCCHNAGKPSGAQYVAFHRIAFEHQIECLLPHNHSAFSNSDPLGGALLGDVNHAGRAALIGLALRAALLWGRRETALARRLMTSLRRTMRFARKQRAGRSRDVRLSHQAFSDQERRNTYPAQTR